MENLRRMNVRLVKLWVLVSAALLMMNVVVQGKKTTPNIVVVVVDDLGWNDVSHGDGKAKIETPVVDRLAGEEGIKLTSHYAFNWCGPSRASLMSGRLPAHVYMYKVDELAVNPLDPASGSNGISSRMSLISDKMKSAGYATHYSGKWGVGYATKEHMPLQRGYDTFFGYLNSGNDYWDETRSKGEMASPGICEMNDVVLTDIWRQDQPAFKANGTVWEDFMFTENSVNVIQNHDVEKPLFLFHAFHSVHTPLDPPKEMEANYTHIRNPSRRAYASMVSFVDQSIGKFVDALKEKGMWENTIMLVTSDNGGPIYAGKHNKLFGSANNKPLRGGKTSDWEGGIRVRSFLSGGYLPKQVRGTTRDGLIHLADWFGTFCNVVGIDPTDDKAAQYEGIPPIDSIDQWDYLMGKTKTSPRKSIFISDQTYIKGNWKLMMGNAATNMPPLPEIVLALLPPPSLMKFDVISVGYGPRALMNTFHRGRNCTNGCLFNLDADISEKTDLSKFFPEIKAAMLKELNQLRETIYKPYVPEASVKTCQQLQAYGGYYAPFYPVIDYIPGVEVPYL